MDRIETLRRNIPEIVEGLPVRLVYLHGSVARGEATPLSDVDLALVCDEGLSPRERLEVIFHVTAELSRRAGIAEADVRVINDAPLVLRGGARVCFSTPATRPTASPTRPAPATNISTSSHSIVACRRRS